MKNFYKYVEEIEHDFNSHDMHSREILFLMNEKAIQKFNVDAFTIIFSNAGAIVRFNEYGTINVGTFYIIGASYITCISNPGAIFELIISHMKSDNLETKTEYYASNLSLFKEYNVRMHSQIILNRRVNRREQDEKDYQFILK